MSEGVWVGVFVCEVENFPPSFIAIHVHVYKPHCVCSVTPHLFSGLCVCVCVCLCLCCVFFLCIYMCA